ncbi:hypothetical protein J6590_081742 [Homalodisca vitripennis]|nr:hypothetical protein J6590_081742 [Homalodisca vitripennis]
MEHGISSSSSLEACAYKCQADEADAEDDAGHHPDTQRHLSYKGQHYAKLSVKRLTMTRVSDKQQ